MSESQGWPRLGSLESEILDALFILDGDRGATIRDVAKALRDRDHGRAYNTVMTVMARLADKGLLERERDGRAYRYRTARSTRGGMLELMAQREWAQLGEVVGWDVLIEVVPAVAREKGYWPQLRAAVKAAIKERRAAQST